MHPLLDLESHIHALRWRRLLSLGPSMLLRKTRTVLRMRPYTAIWSLLPPRRLSSRINRRTLMHTISLRHRHQYLSILPKYLLARQEAYRLPIRRNERSTYSFAHLCTMYHTSTQYRITWKLIQIIQSRSRQFTIRIKCRCRYAPRETEHVENIDFPLLCVSCGKKRGNFER